MALFQCSCGVRVEMEPRFGDMITSVHHLHRAARLDGTSAVVRMEEIRVPAPPDLTHAAEYAAPLRPPDHTQNLAWADTAVSGEPEQVLIGSRAS